MTKREQERCDAALSYLKDLKLNLPQVVTDSAYFIAGAKWAENAILDKACEWIEKHIFDFPWYDNEYGDFSSKDVANALRKAMEE